MNKFENKYCPILYLNNELYTFAYSTFEAKGYHKLAHIKVLTYMAVMAVSVDYTPIPANLPKQNTNRYYSKGYPAPNTNIKSNKPTILQFPKR